MSDLYTEILEFNKMSFNREKLIEDYAQSILDGWDLDTLLSFAYGEIVENLNDYSNESLIQEVKEYNPDLLEDYTM